MINTHRTTWTNNNKIFIDKEIICDECDVKYHTPSELMVHQYKEHDIKIPTQANTELETVDRTVLRHQQISDKSLDFIFDTELGQSDSKSALSSQAIKDLNAHEFVYDVDDIVHVISLPSIRAKSRVRTQMRLVVPIQMRKQIMAEVHEGGLSAHPGINHMYDKLCDSVWWPGMLRDVVRYIKGCIICQRTKTNKQQSVLPRPMTVPSGPWKHIGMDITGPLPVTKAQNMYILVIVDHFTRWVEAIPFTKEQLNSASLAELVLQHVICRHALVEEVQTDKGSVFISDIMSSVYKQLGIKRMNTSSFHPQSNGMTERFNRTVKMTLKAWCNEEQDDWDVLLPYAVFAYNTAYHSTLQESPFYLLYGRDPRLPIDILTGKKTEAYTDVHSYASVITDRLYKVHKRVRDIMINVNEQRLIAIENEEVPSYDIGAKVWLHDPTTKRNTSEKLTIRWNGPYTVIQRVNDVNYYIEMNGKGQLVHVNRLKRYIPSIYEEDNNVVLEYRKALEDLEIVERVALEIATKKKQMEYEIERLKARKEVEQSMKNNNIDHEEAISNAETKKITICDEHDDVQ